MFIIKIKTMIYESYTKTDTYYVFNGKDGEKCIIPSTDVILVDDESGLLSIKLTATRKTIGLVPRN